MKLDIERVKEKFCRYSGEALDETERGSLCAMLCEDCTNTVQRLVNSMDGESPEVEGYAAALAFYQLALNDEATTPKAVSADGVSITHGDSVKSAAAFLKSKRAEAAKYLGEEDFYFGRA